MPGGGELQAPVSHGPGWLALAMLLLSAVAAYYAFVLWRYQDRPPRRPKPGAARDTCLKDLDAIEAQGRSGRLAPRAGPPRGSGARRRFVAQATGAPATRMTLADLRAGGNDRLAQLVALIYP